MKPIELHVRIDDRMFRRYCAFDTFRRQRRWYLPVLTAMLLITAALAGLLGIIKMSETVSGLLMGLGIAVPLVVFGLYFIQIEAQIAGQHLKQAPAVYSLRLSEAGVQVTNDQKAEAPLELPWRGCWAAFRRKDCVYLYVNPARALILPDGQASVPAEELWRFLQANLGNEKCVSKK